MIVKAVFVLLLVAAANAYYTTDRYDYRTSPTYHYTTFPWYRTTEDIRTSPCEWVFNVSGTISSSGSYNSPSIYRMCWKIAVPDEKYALLTLLTLSARYNGPKVKVIVAGENVSSLNPNDLNTVITVSDDVEVALYVQWDWKFRLSFVTVDLACTSDSSFRCSNYSCIHESKVCDGILDCEEGQDEDDCENILIGGIRQSRLDAVSWLKKQRTTSTIWRKNTQRAITALYLADGVDMGEEEDMLDRELQLKTAVALWRNSTDPVTTNELGMFVNALLVSCHDPRRFYGLDLVRLLKEQVERSSAGDYPLASLALCNADEPSTIKEIKELRSILDSDSGHPFLLDVQAVALMALECIKNRRPGQTIVSTIVNSTIARFRELQRDDGSFGNIYTTALVMQALVGSGEVENSQWEPAIQFLLKQQKKDSSFGDFLATYLVLPVLNGKSLVDIANVNCSSDHKKPKDEDPISDIENRLGPKINVKYMLYIGDSIDVAQSIFLRVPENINAYEVMKVAAANDAKYKFESHLNGENIYIYSIGGIVNDPEAGKFWLLHVVNSTEQVEPIKMSPDKRTIKDGESVLMWYKTVFV